MERDFEGALHKAGGKHPQCSRLLAYLQRPRINLASSRRHRDAIGWFDRALAVEHGEGAFFLNRGDCHRATGAVGQALTDYERAAELSAGDAQVQWTIQSRIAVVHNERGAQLFNHAAARQAAVVFSRAIECNPKVPPSNAPGPSAAHASAHHTSTSQP